MRRSVNLLVAVAVLLLSTNKVIVTTASAELSSLRSTSSTGVAVRHDARSLRALNGLSLRQLLAPWAAKIKRNIPGTAKYNAAKKAKAEKAEAIRTKKADLAKARKAQEAVQAQKIRDHEAAKAAAKAAAKVANDAKKKVRKLFGSGKEQLTAQRIHDVGGFDEWVVKLSQQSDGDNKILFTAIADSDKKVMAVKEYLIDATQLSPFEVRSAAFKVGHAYETFIDNLNKGIKS